MTPIQIIGLLALAAAARAWIAGCDFFLGPEDKWDQPSPFDKWRARK